MEDSETVLRARFSWVRHYQQSKDAGLTCLPLRHFPPHLTKMVATDTKRWAKRVWFPAAAVAIDFLNQRSRTLTPRRYLGLRNGRRLGPKSIQSELRRLHQTSFSTATIWRILARHGVSASVRPRRKPKVPKRYNRPIPGDRVQIDNCKIEKKLYQFTAIDDCTRLRVLRLYDARNGANAAAFVEQIQAAFPFPIQRIQSDRGPEFISDSFQKVLRAKHIKFRPIRARSPHLNGKVERSQQTDRNEFWATVEKSQRDLVGSAAALAEWKRHYNQNRGHSALSGKTPLQHFEELAATVPTAAAVGEAFDEAKEKWHTNWPYGWTYTEEKGFFLKRCR